MQLTLRQLRIFEAVAKHGSISRAADALGLTQPAVSMQIKQMEDQLGLVVVEQVGKKFALTDAGQELRHHAECISKQTAELATSMEQFRKLERGILRVAVVSTANYFLPPLIARFSHEHPGVRLSLKVANREAVLALVTTNEAELAILGHTPERVDIAGPILYGQPPRCHCSPRSSAGVAETHTASSDRGRAHRNTRAGFRNAGRHGAIPRRGGHQLSARMRTQYKRGHQAGRPGRAWNWRRARTDDRARTPDWTTCGPGV